jgi:MoxR-like ATPase
MSKVETSFLVASKLHAALSSVIRGRGDTISLVITALLADGHVLLEDYPGSGKTTLTKTLGRLIEDDRSLDEKNKSAILPFRRIQFTPDLLPGDILGVNVFEPKSGTFNFIHGPIFAHVLLADEMNRTGPKVQAAFLECMAEKQVTIDNVSYRLDPLFFVVGTQNPLDVAGTYPLPIVQLDRFLLRVPMSYVSAEIEEEVLATHSTLIKTSQEIHPVVSRSQLLHAREEVERVTVSRELRQAIVEIVQATRVHPLIQFGASTRAALMLQQAMKAWAASKSRDYATEDDLKFLARYVLSHRLKFVGNSANESLDEIILPVIDHLSAS